MDNCNFYRFGIALKRGTLQVHANEIKDELPIIRGEFNRNKPYTFEYYSGTKLYDLLNTGWVSLNLMSDKIIDALKENNITGWKTYPAKIYNKNKELIKGYSLFAITGKAGPLDRSLSEKFWKEPPVPEGNPFQIYQGRYFDVETWDGSDIFLLENTVSITITEKVKNVFTKIKASNILIKRLDEIEDRVI